MPNDSSSSPKVYYSIESKQKEGMFFSRDAVIVHEFWRENAFGALILGIFLFFSLFICFISTFRGAVLISVLIIVSGIGEVFYLYKLFHALITILNPLVFDILNGTFYPEGRSHAESSVPLQEIDHLQLLGIEKNHKFHHELNAILKDGKPLHIIDYNTYSKCAADAQKLAERLTLPLKDEDGEPFVDLPGKHKGPLHKSSGIYYQETHLVFKEDSISLHATLGFFLFYMYPMFCSLPLIFIGLFESHGWYAIIAIIIGVCMCMFWLFICYNNWKKQTAPFFDIPDGMFYPNHFKRDASSISLKQLDHLEILTKCVSGNKNYYPRELNVVLKDGSRYNIMNNYENPKRLLADAYALANRLSLPLVNAHDGKTIPIPPTDNPKKNS